ncbi:hypothetical protein VTN00DRAFT_6049 [Thermoascus crustaceus]|uniref:uncharacterized protein n=1 Tax=Thermoascus crustaceus TaxID=5088 RepID=UPI003742B595
MASGLSLASLMDSNEIQSTNILAKRQCPCDYVSLRPLCIVTIIQFLPTSEKVRAGSAYFSEKNHMTCGGIITTAKLMVVFSVGTAAGGGFLSAMK